MFRSTLIAAGAVALCGTGFAQQQLDPAKIHPITVPVRDAGVFNWNTKQWVSGPKANHQLASAYTVFRNDCTWTGGGFYYAPENCEDVISTGRLPGASTPARSLTGVGTNGLHLQSGVALSGATDDQIINNFQFAYCTFWPTGSVDLKIGFYDNLRGFCANGVPTTGKPYNLTLTSQASPFGTLTAYFDFGAPSSFSLPGSTVGGAQACWIITITFPNNGGFCMASEGEGTWDNNGDLDQFSWSFQHDNPNSTFGGNGPLITGEPTTGGFGAGSYNIPVGSDFVFGGDCGTGFEAGDGWWLNVDGVAPGMPNTATGPGANCPNQAGGGTGCYWFGGWPGGPLGSFWMVMGSTGSCAGCSNRPVNYCTAGTSLAGCSAMISGSGSSSASATSGFNLNLSNVDPGRQALFFFADNGRQANSWGNGNSYQCVVPPVKRTASGSTVGSGVCDGTFTVDLNARWAAKPNQNPGAGAVVQAQGWFRDPQNTSNQTTALSNGLEWTVCP